MAAACFIMNEKEKEQEHQSWVAAHTSLALGDDLESFDHQTYYKADIKRETETLRCLVMISRKDQSSNRFVSKIILPGWKTLPVDTKINLMVTRKFNYTDDKGKTWVIEPDFEPAADNYMEKIKGLEFLNGNFYASIDGEYYHSLNCQYRRSISRNNLIRVTATTATLYGLSPCEHCAARFASLS